MKNFRKDSVQKSYLSKKISTKNRRALSTVVSTAIIMSSIAIMGTVLVGWSNSNLFTQQAQLESSFNAKMNKLNETILIENIWFGTSPNIVNVTLGNVGIIGLNVTSIQLVNSTDTHLILISEGGVSPGDDFSIQETYNCDAGETVDFTITTNRGNYFTTQEVT